VSAWGSRPVVLFRALGTENGTGLDESHAANWGTYRGCCSAAGCPVALLALRVACGLLQLFDVVHMHIMRQEGAGAAHRGVQQAGSAHLVLAGHVGALGEEEVDCLGAGHRGGHHQRGVAPLGRAARRQGTLRADEMRPDLARPDDMR
jgi:hypothetical protein